MASKVIIELDQINKNTFLLYGMIIFIFIFICYLFISNNKNYENNSKFTAIFNTVDGITEKSNVLISGIKIGKIDSITLQDDFKVLINGFIDNNIAIPKDSVIKIDTYGYFGKKYLSIIPGYDSNFDEDKTFIFSNTADSYTVDFLARHLSNKKQ